MKFTFAKTLFAGSLFALGTVGLVACGDDSSSGASDNGGGGGEPIEVPTQQDATISMEGLSSRQSGDDIKFSGIIKLVTTDTSSQNSDALQFTNVKYTVGKGTDVATLTSIDAVVNHTVVTPTNHAIDLGSIQSANVSISMTDPAFTECGKYMLVVTATANDGVQDFFNTQVIPFERDSLEYCREPESSSSAEPVVNEITMTSCQVNLSTNIMPGLNFASCTGVLAAEAATADIIFSKTGNRNNYEIEAASGNGTLFTPITNGDLPPAADDYEVDIWPEVVNNRDAYLSDFKFRDIAGTSISEMLMNSSQIYMAKTVGGDPATGVGIYAFAIVDYTEGNNGDHDLIIKVYKVAQ